MDTHINGSSNGSVNVNGNGVGHASHADDGASIDIRKILNEIFEIRGWVATGVFAGICIGLIYLFSTTPIFQEKTQIQLDPDNKSVQSLLGDMPMSSNEEKFHQTQIKKLKNPQVIRLTLNDLNEAGFRNFAVESETQLSSLINIKPIRLSRLVDIEVEHPNPDIAVFIADKLVEKYIQLSYDSKFHSYEEAKKYFLEQAKKIEKQITDKEREIFEYSLKFPQYQFDVKDDIIVEKIKSVQGQIVSNQNAIADYVSSAEMIELAGDDIVRLLEVPRISRTASIQNLRNEKENALLKFASISSRYKSKHPKFIEIHDKIEEISRLMRNEVSRIYAETVKEEIRTQKTISRLQKDLAALEKDKLDKTAAGIELSKMRSELQILMIKYQQTLEKFNDSSMASKETYGNIQVVHPAIASDGPVKPRKSLIMMMFVMGFGSLFGGGAYLANNINRQSTIRCEDMDTMFESPILGVIPNFKSFNQKEDLFTRDKDNDYQFIEPFRTVRTSIELMYKTNDYKIISVTSSLPNEGKTFTSVNLANVYAKSGMKTLLIDLDLRNPSVKRFVDFHPGFCLTEFLSGEGNVEVEHIIRETEHGFDVAPTSTITNNPSLLLSSDNLKKFLEHARHEYDKIIIDSPPLNLLSDALIIGNETGNLLLVAEYRKTTTEDIKYNLRRINSCDIHNLGIVINKYEHTRGLFRYGYGYGYGYGAAAYDYRNGYSYEKLREKELLKN